MRKEVYESPFTEKMEVEVEGNFCSSGDPAMIEAQKSTIEVDAYSGFSAETGEEITNDITFE